MPLNEDVVLSCLSQLLTTADKPEEKKPTWSRRLSGKKGEVALVTSRLTNSAAAPFLSPHLTNLSNLLLGDRPINWQTWHLCCFCPNIPPFLQDLHMLVSSALILHVSAAYFVYPVVNNSCLNGFFVSIFHTVTNSTCLSQFFKSLLNYFKHVRNFIISFSWSDRKMWNYQEIGSCTQFYIIHRNYTCLSPSLDHRLHENKNRVTYTFVPPGPSTYQGYLQ